MKQKKYLAHMIVLLLISILSQVVYSQDPQQDEQKKAMDMYMMLGAVNENHQYFKNFVGTWDVKSTMWMTPDAPPSVSQNTAAAELILDGRFLMMKIKGVMMGQPFEALQIGGYDNLQKKYITFWIDNTGTAFYLTTGVRDSVTKIMTETGEWPEPMSGGTIKVRGTTKIVSADEFIYEMFMMGPDGKEFKTLENVATRRK